MDPSRLLRLPSDGWRKTAVINTIIVAFFVVANFCILVWSLAKSGISGNNVFSKGNCSKIAQLDTFLHLLLNIASSLIIASSNFFMQILNSPTRAEVDRAHARGHWLEIGVPSLRNVLNVSSYKSLAWVLFSLSSVPIHLLFNASVFTVEYSGSDWSMALVSESLLHGTPYTLPGAALTLGGTYCADPRSNIAEGDYQGSNFGNGESDPEHSSQKLTDVATLMDTATQNLTVSDCKSEYQTCQGLHRYRNVLLVIASGDEPTDSQSWVISDIYDMQEPVGNVYNLSALELCDERLQNETFQSVWEPYFEHTSMSQPNSLWFSSTCQKVAVTVADIKDGCINSCTGPLGTTSSWSFDKSGINSTQVKSSNWEFPWLYADDLNSALRSRTTWGQVFYNHTWRASHPELWPNMCIGIPRPSYRKTSTNNIRVKYCLAEPFEQDCKVAVSNMLLLAVTACIFIKLILCMSVVLALRDDPLVTPGDAVASFIIVPDPTTVGKCAASIMDIRFRPSEPKPLQRQERPKRLAHTISPAIWATNYVFFLILLIILGIVMNGAFSQYPLSNV